MLAGVKARRHRSERRLYENHSRRRLDMASIWLRRVLALIRRFPLRPIRSEAELDRATAVINTLLDRAKLDAAEDDYLDVLSNLVEHYEDKHHAIGEAT